MNNSRTLLLTGFEPFDEYPLNCSAEVAARLDGAEVNGWQIQSLVLPVVFGEDLRRIEPVLERLQPAVVLGMGLAGAAEAIWVERYGKNLKSPRGKPALEEILPGGPARLEASIPVERITEAILGCGLPAIVHEDAGAYLCNHLLYRLIYSSPPGRRCGFLHLPPATEHLSANQQEGILSLSIDDLTRAVAAAIAAIPTS